MYARTSPHYMPYGAYEMKATYQRNLMVATLLTVVLVAGMTATGSLLLRVPAVIETEPPRDTVLIDLTLWDPPQISLDPPKFGENRPPVQPLSGGIPTPVADELIADSTDNLLPTREELKQHDDRGGVPGDGDGVYVIDTNAVEFIPEPDDFVPVEIEPKMIHEAAPIYPRLAEQAGITGRVWVKALVDEQGNVMKAMVARSSGTASLDQAAVDAAYKCKFSPGIQNQHPVKVWVTFDYKFVLE